MNSWYAMSDSAIVKEIGRLVKLIRLQKNITQQQLADQVGLNRTTISQLENGRTSSLLSFIQVLRGLNTLSEGSAISPLKLAKQEGLMRKNASVKKKIDHQPPEESTW
jgi:transcriptional regulator with XRE-family HTH domain